MITPFFGSTRVKALLILIASASMHPSVCMATDPDLAPATMVKARDVLPNAYFRSVHYTIDDDVTRSDFFYRFRVVSDFGSFEPSSLSMLQIRLYEILTISEVMPQLRRSGFALDQDPGRRGVGGESVAGILSDPLGTAGQLMGNVRYNLESTFVEQPVVENEDHIDLKKQTSNDPGPHKRSAAAQLGVDVYSSNRELQGILDILAEARSSGKLRQSVAPAQNQLVSPPPFGSGALDRRLRSQLKNSSAAEINEYVDSRLRSFNVSAADRIGLLTHQRYTPRSRLYLSTYLGQFAKAGDLHNLVHAALGATAEAQAQAFVNLARMAAFLHLGGNEIRQIIMRQNFAILLTTHNELAAVLPIDYFDWSDDSVGLVDELDALRRAETAGAVSILIAGSVSRGAKKELDARKIQFREGYSF